MYFLESCKTAHFTVKQRQELWELLLGNYNSSVRSYHGLSHLVAMFDFVTSASIQHGISVQCPSVLHWSIWFHDIVYQPSSHENEEQSADLASQMLGAVLPDEQVRRVQHFINATKRHVCSDAQDTDLQLFLDADLCILGAQPSDYVQYAAAIRKEYIHMDRDAYICGRANVLRSFLQRPSLYFTPLGQKLFEEQARLNLQQELDCLEQGRLLEETSIM